MPHGLYRAACIRQVGCRRRLRSNSKLIGKRLSKSILGSTRNVVSQNVVFRIVAFARRLEKDVQDKEKQRTVCKSILDDNGLPQVGHFLKEFEASLLETGRLWSEAQTFAKIVGWLRSPNSHSFVFASRESAISKRIWGHRKSGFSLNFGDLEIGKQSAVRQVYVTLCVANYYKQTF